MKIVGNYFQDYFHRISLRKTEKILKVCEPPSVEIYKKDFEEGLLSIFLTNGCYKQRNFSLHEDFNDWDLLHEFDDYC
jgi:hypothetical protein